MFRKNKNQNFALKSDSKIVRSLDDEFFNTLRYVERKINDNDEEMAKTGLKYAQRLKEIRGFETATDRKYSEVFRQFMEEFYPQSHNQFSDYSE